MTMLSHKRVDLVNLLVDTKSFNKSNGKFMKSAALDPNDYRLNTIVWLDANGFAWHKRAHLAACHYGDIDLVRRGEGTNILVYVIHRVQSIEVFKYLVERKCRINYASVVGDALHYWRKITELKHFNSVDTVFLHRCENRDINVLY